MGKVLISPISTNDPVGKKYLNINNFEWRDGPMLHIARHYQVEKIYLLFTSEMEERKKCVKEHLDYLFKTLKINPTIIYEKIECHDASDFEFFKIFSEINKRIIDANPGCEFLANISSGTPQMIASMCLDVITHGRNIKLIQVKSPNERSNNQNSCCEPQNNADYDNGAPSRCVEPKLSLFYDSVFVSRLKAYVSAYQYSRALDLIENTLNESESKYLKLLCSIGESFLQLDYLQMSKICKEINFPVPEVKDEKITLIYMALKALEITYKNRQYTDFIVRITPIIFETGKILIKEWIKEYTYEKNGKLFYNETNKYFYFFNIIDIYEKHRPTETDDMINLMQTLRDIERELRNLVAHNLTKITEEDCKNVTRQNLNKELTPKEIYDKVKEFVFKVVGNNDLRFLDDLNQAIFAELEGNKKAA